jgi:hypothetical protein
VTVAVTTTGACSGLQVRFKPDDTTVQVATMTEGTPSNWTATLSKTAGLWSAGNKPLIIRNSDNDIVATLNLTVN